MKIYKFENFTEFPKTSGLYYFYDIDDKLLYIGKASNLQLRMRTHSHSFWAVTQFKKGIELCDLFIHNFEEGDADSELYQKIKRFEVNQRIRISFDFAPVNIDYVLDKVDRVRILELNKEEMTELENKEIERFSPPYNYESMDPLYEEAREYFDELSADFYEKFELVKTMGKDLLSPRADS